MDASGAQSAIFLIPRSSRAWKGSEALWVTVAGWALAAEKKLGRAIVVTTDRIANPREVLDYPLSKTRVTGNRSKARRFFPPFVRIFINDLILLFKSRLSKYEINLPLDGAVQFIWEQHDLFPNLRGRRMAKRYKAPLIKFVHAPVVWEASKWGVKRYFWGKILEKNESKSLRKADLVLVVSAEVKEKIVQMGIDEEKVMIAPMGVDPDLFSTDHLRPFETVASYGLDNKIVIGWTGSFRKFHGIDSLIIAFSSISKVFPEARLMLVGTGVERKSAEQLVSDLKVKEKVIFTGKIPYSKIPEYISLFDIAVVSAERAEGFHYSPLKLREYMAAGKAVLAPRAGEITETFEDNAEIKLFSLGDLKDLEKGMMELINNQALRERIGTAGKTKILRSGTWETGLNKVLQYLEKCKS